MHGKERGVEMDYSTIRDDGALMNLAAKVVDPDRRNTLVVLSADRYGRPGFDPADIGDALAGTDVDVYWLPDPPAANRLDGLTDGVACMYNGAAAILHAGQGAIIVLDKGPASPDYLIGRAMAHATFMRRPDPKPAPAADAGDRPDGRICAPCSTIRTIGWIWRSGSHGRVSSRRKASGRTVCPPVGP